MPPAAQRTVYVRRADAESEYFEGGSEVDDVGGAGSGQEVEEAAVGSGAAKLGRVGGEDTAASDRTEQTVRTRHHARNWGWERNSKAMCQPTDTPAHSKVNFKSQSTRHTDSKHVARHWPLERDAKYRAKDLKREQPNISTIGRYTLIGPAPGERLNGQIVKGGVLSTFSSTEIPKAVGFSTIATGTQSFHALSTFDPATTVDSHHFTVKGPPATSTPFISHGDRRIDNHLPASYVVSWCAILALLSVLWIISTLLYFVNFPPQFLLQRRATRKHRKKQYAKIPEDTGNDQWEDQAIGSAAFTTSSDTPSLTSPCLRTRRQRSQEHSDAETVGLGIELSDMGIKRQRSFINTLTTNKPLPVPSRSASTPRTAPLSAKSQFDHAPQITGIHPQDLENGLTVSAHNYNYDYDRTYLSPHRLSPYSSASEASSASSSRSASPHRVLKKVGDGIEYFAGKAAKLMHDQVREDPEEDLILPVRDNERERGAKGLERRY